MKKIALAVLIGATALSPTYAKKKVEISGLELQQIQSRDFEAGKDVTFPAVMSVLQDAGYRIQTGDMDTGLITGIGSSAGKLTWAPFVGFGRSKKTPVVSAYIEGRGKGMSRIRLNFVMTKKVSNVYNGGIEDEEPVIDAAVYRDAFEKINKAVFVRQALDAPPAQAEPAARALSPSQTPSAAVAGKVTTASSSAPPAP